MTIRNIKGSISLGALCILLLHVIFPELWIDKVSLGLLSLAVVPWLSPLIKSAEFPFGFKITLRDMKEAGEKITGSAYVLKAEPGEFKVQGFAPTVVVGPPDPNLELVALRIEVEKRLRALAEKAGLASQHSVLDVASSLRRAGVLQVAELSGLISLVEAGNRASHGAKAAPAISEWARTAGLQVLAVLDRKLES